MLQGFTGGFGGAIHPHRFDFISCLSEPPGAREANTFVFQLENFSLWLAFEFGWAVANHGLWDDFIF